MTAPTRPSIPNLTSAESQPRHKLEDILARPSVACRGFTLLSDRKRRGGHCPVCDYRAWCGGCRARAYAYTGDITAGDPGCRYNEHEWEELAAAARNALPMRQ